MSKIKTIVKVIQNSQTSKASIWYFVGTAIETGLGVLMMPIYTRLLSTADYGIVNTYNSWVPMISISISLSAAMSVRSAVYDYKDKLTTYCQSLFSFYTINSLILWFVLSLGFLLFEFDTSYDLLLLCLIQGLISTIIGTINQRLLMEGDYRRRTLLMAGPVIVSSLIGVPVILMLESKKYYGRIIPSIIILAFIALFYIIRYVRQTKRKVVFEKEYIKYALAISIPLIFHQLSLNILSNMDRTMITALYDVNATGIYSVTYNIGIGMTIILSVFDSVWIPWFYKQMDGGDKNVINQVNKYSLIGMTAFAAAYMLGAPELLKLLADKEYWSGIWMLPPIVLASFFMFLNTFPVNLEYYSKKTKKIASNTIIAALVNLGLNFIFIPMYGAVAAAYTTVAAYAVLYFLQAIAGKRIDNNLFYIRYVFIAFLFMAGVTIVCYFFMEYWFLRWGLAGGIFVIGMSFLVLKNKNNYIVEKGQ